MDYVRIKDSIILKKADFRIREDNEKFYILVNPMNHSWYCVSKGFLDLCSLCDGKKTLIEIAKQYSSQQNVNYKRIFNDLQTVFIKAIKLGILLEKEA